MIKDYASLHNHSHFSIMDGISLPEEMVKAAKEKGLKSIAITDHGHAHGHADFFLAGKKHGVRTILGIEAYVIDDLDEWAILKEKHHAGKKSSDGSKDEEDNEDDDGKKIWRKDHLILLAKDQEGLSNLYRLIHKSYKHGFYGKPRMDKKMLSAHSRGLIATSACIGGVIAKKIHKFLINECPWIDVIRNSEEYGEIFGKDNFFLELQFNEMEEQKIVNELLLKVKKTTKLKLTSSTDSHYIDKDGWKAQEMMHMLRSNRTMASRGDWKFNVKQLYIKSAEEMWKSYELMPCGVDETSAIESMENTLLIDSLITDFEPDRHQRLPKLEFDNPFKELGERSIEGLRKLGLAENEEYKKRLLHELKVIKDKGFSNYFLIMKKIIGEAKKKMLVGAGRGSSAGSLVCYTLGITDLDPIKNDLMFERFLDPARVELPDIDVDFQDTDTVKDMLRNMFGEDNVACLSVYGTFQIKGLLKDLGRIYDLDHNMINDVNRKIEKELRALYVGQDKSTIVIKLEDIVRVSKTFNEFVAKNPDVGQHLKSLYGRNRHVGRHAAGVVIGDDLPSETALWVQKDKETGKPITHASFTEGIVNKNASAMGHVKFDILSIAALRVIDHALHLISKKTGKTIDELRESIRPHNIDLDDQNVLKTVFHPPGNFAGVFQFTESGIRKLALAVRPDVFADISAITSIYRPGPLGGGFDKMFTHNKHNPDDVRYDHPLLESILKKTRGCIVFQEQLMQICNVLGKMDMKDVNRVRKVLLKKDKSKSEEFLKKENDELRGKFVSGCAENGYEEKLALELWEKLIKFGGYGFNKSHSDAYTVMTMQTAWLSTYYPLEFYAALLSKGQSGELQQYVTDIQRRGIKVLPVDVNKSKMYHIIEEHDGIGAIRLSLNSVLGVGPAAIEKIVKSQPYSDFLDFIERSGASKTTIQPLVLVGAFDSLFTPSVECSGPNMKALDEFCNVLWENPKLKQKRNKEELKKIFWEKTSGSTLCEKIEDYALHEKVFMQNELMGFSVVGSPFNILNRDKKIESVYGDTLVSYQDFIESDDDVVTLPVILKDVREKAQRNGQMMAFMKFMTRDGDEFDAPCFATIWRHVRDDVKRGYVYIVTFNRKIDDDSNGMIVGRPGFAHSKNSAISYFVNVDDIDG